MSSILPIQKGQNKKNELLMELLCEILDTAKLENKLIIITGGLTVDIQAAIFRGDELLTREHADVDVVCLKEDILFWQNWMIKKKYKIKNWKEALHPEYTFYAYYILKNEGAEEITIRADFDSFEIRSDGVLYYPARDAIETASFNSFTIKKLWMGREIIMDPYNKTLKDKREENAAKKEPRREKDIHDHALFGVEWQ